MDIRAADDGGVVGAGYTQDFGEGSYEMVLFKMSSAGDLEWIKTFGTSSE